MNKSSLSKNVSYKFDMSQKQSRDIVDFVFKEIKNELLFRSGAITISDMFRIHVKSYEAKMRYVPSTREMKEFPAGKTVKLVCSPRLKHEINFPLI